MHRDIVVFGNSVFGKLFGKLPKALFFLGKLRGVVGAGSLFGNVFGNLRSLTGFWKARWLGAEGGGVLVMRNKNYKGRCEKRTSEKSREVCRIYDEIQKAYLAILEGRRDITEIR